MFIPKATKDMYIGIFVCCVARSDISRMISTGIRRKLGAPHLTYCAPSSIVCGMFVNIRITMCGPKNENAKKRIPTASQIAMANPIVFRMFGRSFAPQNWATNVDDPAENPNRNIHPIKYICIPAPTAPSSASPSAPTIRLSTRFSEEATRLCSAIGTATTASCR